MSIQFSILVKISKNVDFCHNLRNWSILVKVFEIVGFAKIFRILNNGQHFRKILV